MSSRTRWYDRPEMHLIVSVLGIGTVAAVVDGMVRLVHWLGRL
jgi:hypothetical protein